MKKYILVFVLGAFTTVCCTGCLDETDQLQPKQITDNMDTVGSGNEDIEERSVASQTVTVPM